MASDAIAYIHGSGWELPIGTELSAHKASLTRSAVDTIRATEGLLESLRPAHCLSRYHSVFMTDTDEIAVIQATGGYTDYLYRVEPEGAVERNHVGWWEIINRHFNTPASSQSASLEQLVGWARSYWAGIECPADLRQKRKPSSWEYRASGATVVEEVDPEPYRMRIIRRPPAAVRRFLEKARAEAEARNACLTP